MAYKLAAAMFLTFVVTLTVFGNETEPCVIALVGDSTVTDDKGWGAAFADTIGNRANVVNFAVGGRSAKSFLDENRLPAVIDAAPDYVLIQFGHNGQPGKGSHRETDPEGNYREYLRTYVRALREIDAKPVIISSLTRRNFDEHGEIRSTLGPWADGARAVAEELDVAFVDLHALSITYHNRMGPEHGTSFNLEPDDRTHLSEVGAQAIGGLIFDGLATIDHPLANLRSDVHQHEPIVETPSCKTSL